MKIGVCFSGMYAHRVKGDFVRLENFQKYIDDKYKTVKKMQ